MSEPKQDPTKSAEYVEPSGVASVICRMGETKYCGVVRAFVVVWAGDAIIIDTGQSERDVPHIQAALKSLGSSIQEVKACILTHGNGDHVGGLRGLCELAEFTVYAHESDAHEVTRRSGVGVDRFLVDGEKLPFCGGTHVIHTPGHSPGHVAVYVEQQHALFAGDSLLSGGGHLVPSPPNMSIDPEQAVASAHALADLSWPVEHVFVGHGEEVVGNGERELAHMLRPRRAVVNPIER